MLEKGADQFTANSIFWIVILIGLVFYTSLVLLGVSLFELYKQLKNKKNSKKLNNYTEANEKVVQIDNTAKINSSENVEILVKNNIDTNAIRTFQHQKKVQQENEKLQIALHYARNHFALYVSDEDLGLVCNAVISYSNKEKISNSKLIETAGLSNLDLYHFGWNIWNHFRPIKQEEISKLLKTVFVSLDDIDLDSIKSHLKDEPQKGNIKIQEDLTDYQKT